MKTIAKTLAGVHTHTHTHKKFNKNNKYKKDSNKAYKYIGFYCYLFCFLIKSKISY